MKKKLLIIALSVVIAICSQAQSFTLAFESGYSFNHAPVAGLNIGLNFKGLVIRTGFDAHMSDKVNDGIILQNKIGYTYNISERFYATAMFGHAYIYRSADNKSMNKSEWLWNPEIGYKWEFKEQPLSFYAGGVKAGDFKIILIGIRSYF